MRRGPTGARLVTALDCDGSETAVLAEPPERLQQLVPLAGVRFAFQRWVLDHLFARGLRHDCSQSRWWLNLVEIIAIRVTIL